MSKCECKKCVHNDVCKYEVVHSTKGCEHYKDKSLCVELPCRCNDCKYYNVYLMECHRPHCNGTMRMMDYCSYAERKLEVGE